jgi:hypothetical protein
VHGDERVRVCSLKQSARADAQSNFVSPPLAAGAKADRADPFGEQMLFFHGARALQFFATIGVPHTSTAAPLALIANVRLPASGGLEPWHDASFVRAEDDAGVLGTIAGMEQPRTDAIYFGQDHDTHVAYDSAAIRHEVAHAVLAEWLPRDVWFVDAQGASSANAAIAEALADYFAAAMSEDPRVGVHAGDGGRSWQIRNLSASLRCPDALSGRPHEDGQIIASALWAARKSLGAALDGALVSALKDLRGVTPLSVEKLLGAVLNALAARQPAAARSVGEIWRERGLAPLCQRVLELVPQQSLSGATGTFFVPAASKSFVLAASVLQLRAAVPPSSLEVELHMRTGAPTTNALETSARFEPALLVKSSPIRWTAAGRHDAELVPAAASGTTGELRFSFPAPKAQTLYLQLVNHGQRAGWYDAVRIIFRSKR